MLSWPINCLQFDLTFVDIGEVDDVHINLAL